MIPNCFESMKAMASRKSGALEQNCNQQACEKSYMQFGKWGECSQECGGGIQTRPFTCFSSMGYAVSSKRCTTALKGITELYQPCNTQACPPFYYQKRCGPGPVLPALAYMLALHTDA